MESVIPRTRSRIDFLDYMRVLAFVSVLIGHKFHKDVVSLSQDVGTHASIRLFFELLSGLTYGGAAGVVVFFFTSGYIITHVIQREQPAEFAIKRIFRVYPLYIIAVIMEILFAHLIHGVPIPAASIIVPRLLLIGDLFSTPYALAGVEWTLRVEIAFYVFMMAAKGGGLVGAPRLIPLVYAAVAAVLFFVGPIPNGPSWSAGYFNLYFPFLLCGSLIYLCQERLSEPKHCMAAVVFILIMFMVNTVTVKAYLKESHHGIIALGIFAAAWLYRDKIAADWLVRLLAELTYSIYLFHNWLWQYLQMLCNWLAIPYIPLRVQILILLFAACYAFYRFIEVPSVAAGRYLAAKLSKRR